MKTVPVLFFFEFTNCACQSKINMLKIFLNVFWITHNYWKIYNLNN
jgi:hypothetical protein